MLQFLKTGPPESNQPIAIIRKQAIRTELRGLERIRYVEREPRFIGRSKSKGRAVWLDVDEAVGTLAPQSQLQEVCHYDSFFSIPRYPSMYLSSNFIVFWHKDVICTLKYLEYA